MIHVDPAGQAHRVRGVDGEVLNQDVVPALEGIREVERVVGGARADAVARDSIVMCFNEMLYGAAIPE